MHRILHVLHSMNCGGVETLLMNLYRVLDTRRYQFDFLVSAPEEMHFEREIAERGGLIHRMPSLRQVGPLNYPKALAAFFAAHPEYRIVHSHLETTTGPILQAAMHAGVPLRVAHSHNTRYTRAGLLALPENALKSWCRKQINPSVTHRLACSPEAARWLFGDAPAQILPNGIDAEAFRFLPAVRRKTRDAMGIPQDARVLLHVGRFQAQKNHRFLMEVWRSYSEKEPTAHLVCVGEGELLPGVKAMAEKLPGADRTRFPGVQADVAPYYSAADVFIFPSLFEGLGIALIEAQAAGLPCLVSEAVPTAALLGDTRRLPLHAAEPWVQALRELSRASAIDRTMGPETVLSAGYDIRSTLASLVKIYDEVNE